MSGVRNSIGGSQRILAIVTLVRLVYPLPGPSAAFAMLVGVVFLEIGMNACPRCGNELARPVEAEESYPRHRACLECSYPLDFDRLWQRVERSSGTDAAVGSLFGPGLRSLTYEAAIQNLRRDFRYGVEVVAEHEHAVVLRVMDQVYVLNFGPAGDCGRYWNSGNESATEE